MQEALLFKDLALVSRVMEMLVDVIQGARDFAPLAVEAVQEQ
jgi:hypothetical protein